MFLLRSNLM